MPVTISFRVAEELKDYLEEEAERRMTTKSAVSRQLLTEKARELMAEQEEARELGRKAAETAKQRGNGGSRREALQSAQEYEFESKSAADAVRTEFERFLAEADDRRLTTVTMRANTPGDAVAEIERRSED